MVSLWFLHPIGHKQFKLELECGQFVSTSLPVPLKSTGPNNLKPVFQRASSRNVARNAFQLAPHYQQPTFIAERRAAEVLVPMSTVRGVAFQDFPYSDLTSQLMGGGGTAALGVVRKSSFQLDPFHLHPETTLFT